MAGADFDEADFDEILSAAPASSEGAAAAMPSACGPATDIPRARKAIAVREFLFDLDRRLVDLSFERGLNPAMGPPRMLSTTGSRRGESDHSQQQNVGLIIKIS